jgi:hypothetical protein
MNTFIIEFFSLDLSVIRDQKMMDGGYLSNMILLEEALN